jgi:hypothetical protein
LLANIWHARSISSCGTVCLEHLEAVQKIMGKILILKGLIAMTKIMVVLMSLDVDCQNSKSQFLNANWEI